MPAYLRLYDGHSVLAAQPYAERGAAEDVLDQVVVDGAAAEDVMVEAEADDPAVAALGVAQGDFSVPQIARRLGVQTASVYHHVDGRDGIVELLRERICAAIDSGTLDGRPWDAAVAAWARSYRAAFAAHPKAIPLLTTSPVRAPRVRRLFRTGPARSFRAAGPGGYAP